MSIIPRPQKIEFKKGFCNLRRKLSIDCGAFYELRSVTEHYLKKELDFADIKDEKQGVTLEYKKVANLKSEAYILHVETDRIQISASTKNGIFYGLMSWIQYSFGKDRVRQGKIVDCPDVAYRGMHLDVSRHFIPVEEVKRLVEIASRLKINHLHWHLSDDHGWRIAMDAFPRLYADNKLETQDAEDAEDAICRGKYLTKGIYSKAEIKEVVEYCRERMIEVIPEIDVPGHVLSALVSYPELACEPKAFDYPRGSIIAEDVLCIGNKSAWKFVYQVFDEIVELFPYDKVHIGGDEVPKVRWMACEKCRTYANQHNIKNGYGMQLHFMQRMIDYLNTKGKTAIVWNDMLKGAQLRGDVICQFWMDTHALDVNAKHYERRYQVIDSDFFHFYFDYSNVMTPMKKVYTYATKFDARKTSNQKRGLYGKECALWTEFVGSKEVLNRLMFPRMFAFAENAWTAKKRLDYPSFKKRLKRLMPLFAQWDVGRFEQVRWESCSVMQRLAMLKRFASIMSWEMLKRQRRSKEADKQAFH